MYEFCYYKHATKKFAEENIYQIQVNNRKNVYNMLSHLTKRKVE